MVKPHNVAHILYVEGADPERDRTILEINGVRSIIIAVPSVEQAALIAAHLVDEEDVVLIELDGGIGPAGATRVVEAVKGRVPVGAVTFGAESVKGVAAFIERYNA